FWLYLINAVLLILHEIDSAYWKEWELFRIKGGADRFLILHIPILFVVLYGLVSVSRQTFFGLILSLFLSLGGIFAFIIHTIFLKKGHEEFNVPVSKSILWITGVLSPIQLGLTIVLWTTR
ncbi:MAG: DUF6713 family protein, partial [bacterium]